MAHLRAIKTPGMFRAVIAGGESFFLAKYDYSQYEAFIQLDRLAAIGHNGTLTLPSILVLGGHYDCLFSLLQIHGDVFHYQDELERTTLMHAVLVGDLKAVQLQMTTIYRERILEYQDIDGKNVLRLAVESECLECIKEIHRVLCHERKSDLFVMQDGYSTVHYAARYGSLRVFKYVIFNTGLEDPTDHFIHLTSNLDSLLHLVMRNMKHRSLEYVQYIIEMHPDLLHARDSFFQRPIDILIDEVNNSNADDDVAARDILEYLEHLKTKEWQESWSSEKAGSSTSHNQKK